MLSTLLIPLLGLLPVILKKRIDVPVKELSEDERIREIAKILLEGVYLMNQSGGPEDPEKKESDGELEIELNENERDTLSLLHQFATLSPSEIQARLSRSRSTVSRLLNSLVAKELVTKKGKTSGTSVVLTEKGRRVVRKLEAEEKEQGVAR